MPESRWSMPLEKRTGAFYTETGKDRRLISCPALLPDKEHPTFPSLSSFCLDTRFNCLFGISSMIRSAGIG